MGLLDGILGSSMDDPRTSAILALAGNMVRGDFGGGLLGAGQAYQNTQDSVLKRQDIAQQIALRNMQVQQAQRSMAMLDKFFGGSQPSGQAPVGQSQPAIPPSPGGDLGSGTFGIPVGGQPAAAAQPNPQTSAMSRIAQMTPDDIAAFQVVTGKDLTPLWKIAKEGIVVQPNTTTVDATTGQRRYNPDVTKGVTLDANNNVVPMPGAVQTQTMLALGPKLAEQFANNVGTVNMRPGNDGRQYPVPQINENPAIQQIFGSLFPNGAGGPNIGGNPSVGVPQGPQRVPAGNGNSITPELAQLIAADAKANGIDNPQLNFVAPGGSFSKPGQGGYTFGMAQNGAVPLNVGGVQPASSSAPASVIRVPQSGAPSPLSGYGMSNAEQAAAAANTEAAKTAAQKAAESAQTYKDTLNDKVANDYALVFRNKQIAPLLDKYQTGGLMPEDRLHLGNSIATSGAMAALFGADNAKKFGAAIAGGDPTAGKVIENQLAAAGITNLLQTLDKEGKPNRAEFQIMNDARESLKSGNATLKDVFELQNRLYQVHYNEQQAIAQAEKAGTYDPRTWAADYAKVKDAQLNQPVPGLPSASNQASGKTVVRTGMYGGKKVVQYSDGTTAYAN